MEGARAKVSVSPPNRWFSRWFSRYSAKRLRRDFHRFRILGDAPGPIPADQPLVVFANHSGWWDPLMALASQPVFFPERTEVYTPIDAEMLERYGIFKRLGFFGVERDTRGVSRFLDQAAEVLRRPGAILYISPQGRFADVRERPVSFQRGIAHLAERVPGAVFLPLAVEYVFWEESRPELLLHFGPGQRFSPSASRENVLAELETGLEAAMDRLAAASLARETSAFRIVLSGRAGVGGWYDAWRFLRAWVTGKEARLHHSDL